MAKWWVSDTHAASSARLHAALGGKGHGMIEGDTLKDALATIGMKNPDINTDSFISPIWAQDGEDGVAVFPMN